MARVFGGRRDASWPDVGRRWHLTAFSSGHGAPDSFEAYVASYAESVGHLHKTASSLREAARESYRGYLEHRRRFNGCFGIGERAEVIRESAIAIILSKDWTGSPADHSDMELVLTFERDGLFSRSGRYYCEAYIFGTIHVEADSFEHLVGQEMPGTSRVSHLQGIYRIEFEGSPDIRTVRLLKVQGHGDDSAAFACLK